SIGSLYRNTGVASDVDVLLTGSIPGGHSEPVAWTRVVHGGRVFYTSLGHPDDFKNENFRRLLINALYWTTNRAPPKTPRSMPAIGVPTLAEKPANAVPADCWPETKPLVTTGDIASQLVDGVDCFLLGELEKSIKNRERQWSRDTSSLEKYNQSVQANRDR